MPFTPGERAGAATYAGIQREALELFAAQGFAATPLRQISARVGTTVAALFYYFQTKDQLLRTVVEPILASWDGLLAGPGAGPGGRRRLHGGQGLRGGGGGLHGVRGRLGGGSGRWVGLGGGGHTSRDD